MDRKNKHQIDSIGILLVAAALYAVTPQESLAGPLTAGGGQFVRVDPQPFIPQDFTLPTLLITRSPEKPITAQEARSESDPESAQMRSELSRDTEDSATLEPQDEPAEPGDPEPVSEAPLLPELPLIWPAPDPAAELLLPLSPRMFVEYFKAGERGTNSVESVLVPVEFVPPVPAASPGSKAVYRVE